MQICRHHWSLAGLAVLAMATLGLAGCGGDDAAWPQLLPTEVLLAEPAILQTAPAAQDPVAATSALAGRAQALRDRAAAMRRLPVIDPATLKQMQASAGGV